MGSLRAAQRQALFSSVHVEWGTPPDLYEALDKEFHFEINACKPDSVWDDLITDWSMMRVFCNPPYGRKIGDWLAKGREAELAVFLLPARTDTGWFHDYALKADEIRFFRGRLEFAGTTIKPREGWLGRAAPFPSMLVIFGR